MKGDFSRSIFQKEKRYSSVRMQQGRVQLDADWNEQLDIAAHHTETTAIDVIGACGAPLHNAGFALTDGPVPKITRGRYYVDGILCENDADVDLDKQPDLPGFALPSAPAAEEFYIAYLDVWQRHITALEDDDIREVALEGPDTTTRTKTVWQVKLLGPLSAPLTCADEPDAWTQLLAGKTGKLSARAQESPPDKNPCIVPPGAGYRRLENQLYRVEIHTPGPLGTASFKWSRDNGSIATLWLDQKNNDLIVSSIGRDKVLNFAPGSTVELLDNRRELRLEEGNYHGDLGLLVKLENAEGQVLMLDPADPNTPTVDKADFPDTDPVTGLPNSPKVRRWDSDGVQIVAMNPTTNNGWLKLEDGVEIKFASGFYNAGDYWLIPARTVKGDVEWPFNAPQPPAGIRHHYCKLAVVCRNVSGFNVVTDCRALFPPLTKLTTLLYVSGDGQEAMPGAALTHPLQVRVVNGQSPVVGAKVRYTVTAGGGTLSVTAPVATVGPDGIAACGWTLGANGAQQVEIVLLDAADQPVRGQVLRFNARTVVPEQGCLCTITVGDGDRSHGQFNGADGLQKALDKARTGGTVCVLRGTYTLERPIVLSNGRNIIVQGNRLETKLLAPQGDIAFRFMNIQGIELHDLIIRADNPRTALPVVEGVVSFLHCLGVVVHGCSLSATLPDNTMSMGGVAGLLIATNQLLVPDPAFPPPLPPLVSDCLVRGTGPGQFIGVALSKYDGAVVSNNQIQILGEGGGVGINLEDDCDGCILDGNTITGVPPDTQNARRGAQGGIHIGSGCDEVTVRDNQIEGGAGYGIGLGSVDTSGASLGGMRGLRIERNRIRGMSLSGIGVLDCDVRQVGSEIRSPVTDGILISANHIENCAYGEAQFIDRFDLAGGPRRIRLSGAVSLWMGNAMHLLDNEVVENGHSGNVIAPHPAGGVFIYSASGGLVLSRNRIRYNQGTGQVDQGSTAFSNGGIAVITSIEMSADQPVLTISDNDVDAPDGTAMFCDVSTGAVHISGNRLAGQIPPLFPVVGIFGGQGELLFNNNHVVSRLVAPRLDSPVTLVARHVTFSANHCTCPDQLPVNSHVLIQCFSATATGNHCLEKQLIDSPLRSLLIIGPPDANPAVPGAQRAITAVANVTTNGVELRPDDPANNQANLRGIPA